MVAAGLGGVADGLEAGSLDFASFVSQPLDGANDSLYFSDLAATEPSVDAGRMNQFKKLSGGEQAVAALDLFYIVLRDAGRDHNLFGSPGYGNYDAGIRATGNPSLAAVRVLNSSNIQAGGASSGVPTVTVAAPNLRALSAASSATGASNATAQEQTNNETQKQSGGQLADSLISVEVIDYGGGKGDDGG